MVYDRAGPAKKEESRDATSCVRGRLVLACLFTSFPERLAGFRCLFLARGTATFHSPPRFFTQQRTRHRLSFNGLHHCFDLCVSVCLYQSRPRGCCTMPFTWAGLRAWVACNSAGVSGCILLICLLVTFLFPPSLPPLLPTAKCAARKAAACPPTHGVTTQADGQRKETRERPRTNARLRSGSSSGRLSRKRTRRGKKL